jgi:hypothetical protein
MPKDNDPQAPPEAAHRGEHRGRMYVVLLVLVVVSMVIVGAVVLRDDERTPSLPSTGHTADNGTRSTATTVSTRTEVASRLREILEIRDRALLARDSELLSDIYTIDCECLKDGQELITQLQREGIVWKGVKTNIAIKSTEEVNDRLWIVVATVKTPSVRIETEGGRLVRVVPPERNIVRFALAKPENKEEWLLGHASTLE